MLVPSGPSTARMMIVSECVTYRDLQANQILNDREFDRMLSEAGAERFSCFITSLIREQVPGQAFDTQVARAKKDITPAHSPLHDKYVLDSVHRGLNGIIRDIELVKPKIVLALGNGPLFALLGKWGIKQWRGSVLKYETPGGHECYVIPTYPPNHIYGIWKDRNTAVHDIRKAWSLSICEAPITPPEYNFIIEPSFPMVTSTLRKMIENARRGPLRLSVDIETRGGHIACLGIAWDHLSAICIPHIRAVNPEFQPDWQVRLNYWREEEEAYIVHLYYQLLTHPNVEVIGQNFIYDAQYILRHFHFVPRFKRDTMLAQHAMFSNMSKGLDFLSSLHCGHHVYWKDESKNWDPKLGERQLWIYNCKDCCVTLEIDDSQQAAIKSFSASWPELPVIHDFRQSLFWPVLETMDRGIKVNNESKAQLSADLAAAIATREAWLESVIGHPLNIKSPKQMLDFFYRELAQKPIISRKTGNPTCDDTALERIIDREPLLLPVGRVIQELRSLGVFRSTFLEAPVDHDQRMRCSFNIAGTETYRFSSSENAFGSGMNLQNIPSGDESSGLPNVRKLFLPDEEMEFFDIDLDSADLRIVVWESNCLEMKQMFAENLKPYVEVAKEYYRDPTIDKSHPSYKLFKALCHGTNYLGTASGLSSRIGLVTHEVERIQKWYYGKFPEIEQWQETIKRNVAGRGYVQNVFGNRCYVFDRIEGTIFNQMVAWVPQSTVACLINRGYKNIYDRHKETQILLQVHDSLAGQYPIHLRERCQQNIISACAVPLPYPSGELIIPVGIKTSTLSWGDCS